MYPSTPSGVNLSESSGNPSLLYLEIFAPKPAIPLKTFYKTPSLNMVF